MLNIVVSDATLYILVKITVLVLAVLMWWMMAAPVAV